MVKKLHIAIDGPVAAGKGTVASKVAQKLGILYVDTGAMYRAVALLGMREGVDLDNEQALLQLLSKHDVNFSSSTSKPGMYEIFLDTENISDKIRTPEVSKNSSIVAKLPRIRKFLVEKQKKIAQDVSAVMEGRDIGSVVLPHAKIKIFLTADSGERAKRRQLQLSQKGVTISLEQVLLETEKRDQQDLTREATPLKVAEGATVIDTTDLTIDQVVEKILGIAKKLQ